MCERRRPRHDVADRVDAGLSGLLRRRIDDDEPAIRLDRRALEPDAIGHGAPAHRHENDVDLY